MPLSPGAKLGPYEILTPLGAGGMGEVYRARDTKLKRDVALKVLPEAFASDPERMARFQREAEVLAALNHPNIAQIYGVEERALVMELVEGETLAGPLPLETALNYARQIAEALEAAHDKGITHRDLKPANVKVTPQGVVKVLDFGLAAVTQASGAGSESAANSPTLTIRATEAGLIMGTAGYMSPEQAAGKSVDKRADIWSFGVVLWEMLTGRRLFDGETISHTLAHVLTAPIDFSSLPATTPPAIRDLLRRSLDRDVKTRLRDIGEARVAIAKYLADPGSGTEVPRGLGARPTRLPWVLSAVLVLALAAALVWIFKPSPPLHVTRFPFTLGEGQMFTNTGRLYLAISPDGTQMVYVANQRLYLRSMAEVDARAIPGTEFANGVTNPVFSPDGKSLAFFTAADGTLKRIAASGGTAVTICPASGNPYGMNWSEQGIVFQQSGKGILRVSPNGGQPELLVSIKDNEQLQGPQMLPGGQAILFTSGTGDSSAAAAWDKAQIVVQTLKSGARKILITGGSDARYLPTGHLVYVLGGVLFAVPFDLRRMEATTGPVGIVEGVTRNAVGGAQFAFSKTGSLVYVPGPAAGVAAGQDSLALVDRKGDVELLKLPPETYGFPRVSPEGKRVAYQIDDGKETSVWIYELSGANAPRRLTLPGTGGNRYPIWSKPSSSGDRERIAFQSDREGDAGIWWQRADGSGAAERLTKPEKGVSHIPDSWSPDGQVFSFTERKAEASAVWTYSLRDKKATLFAEAPRPFLGRSVFSPDGRWLAYQDSNVQENQIYVQPFPPTATKYQVPHDGSSHHPVWSPDGKQLFFAAGPGLLDVVSVSTQPSLTFGPPVRAPRAGFNMAQGFAVRPYDILPDGQHFIGTVPAGQTQAGAGARPAAPQIQVVLNWFEDVKQRAPGR